MVPDEILKKKSDKIEKITNNEKQLADDLFETMYKNNGIGLAAVQVGVLRRINKSLNFLFSKKLSGSVLFGKVTN